jgi:hypothetical protein
LLLRPSTGRATLAAVTGPPNERRRKARQSERSRREEHVTATRSVKPFQDAGDVFKTTPLDCERKAT